MTTSDAQALADRIERLQRELAEAEKRWCEQMREVDRLGEELFRARAALVVSRRETTTQGENR